jgi:hypothetical protein
MAGAIFLTGFFVLYMPENQHILCIILLHYFAVTHKKA